MRRCKDLIKILFNRRSIARLLSTLFCSIIIVIRPFSQYGGTQTAFVALTLKELVFAPQENLAQHLECLILSLMGGMLAIAISLLGLYLSSLAEPDSGLARAVPALFLAFTCFLGGWVKSSLPRLVLATRIASLVWIWLFTTDAGQGDDILRRTREFVWIVLVGALTSLIAGLLVLRWSSAQLAHDVADVLQSLHQCLQAHLDHSLDKDAMSRLHQKLLKQTVALSGTYSQASFELRIGRVGVKTLKPLIGSVEHLRREISWGTAAPKASHKDAHDVSIDPLHDLVLNLGHAILHALLVVRLVMLKCYDVPSSQRVHVPADALQGALLQLTSALKQAEGDLAIFGKDFDISSSVVPDLSHSTQRPFKLSLFSISLVQVMVLLNDSPRLLAHSGLQPQMAHECMHAVKVAESILKTYETGRAKLWHPRFTLAWLGAAPPTIVLEERGAPAEEALSHQSRTELSTEEAREGISEQDDFVHGDKRDKRPHLFIAARLQGRTLSPAWFRSLIGYVWGHPRTISMRLSLSRVLRSITHSNHLKHALKNSIGVTLLSLPAFLPDDSPGMRDIRLCQPVTDCKSSSSTLCSILIKVLLFALGIYDWYVLTSNAFMSPSSLYMQSGTILGALYAFIVGMIAQRNPYAIVVLVTLAEIPASWIVTASSFPSLGVVANITLPPILFTGYFVPESPSIATLAWLRALMISLGILSALLMNSLIYPRLCRVLFLDSACQNVGLLTQLYISLSRDLFQNTAHASLIERRRRLRLEWSIRTLLHRMSVLVVTMNDEVSLVPKPVRRYLQVIASLQRLLDLLTGLRKIREHIPRKHAVAAVASERRELVSCICVSLFACEQVFGARQPLPQFLPSSRQALVRLHSELGHHLKQTREDQTGPQGLSVVYTLAEAVVMADLVRTIEELLDLCRQLFGTTSWFSDHPSLDLTTMISTHEEVGSPFVGH
ncbi:hypothetical protein V5O48_003537 [Marasmius crinis-equi]|uniref:DUF2421 domain-containing protein n=1 Tax=Marasmius crinis-equi TaxID=585013 RepID=A0ABR3FT00_9AGAR